jgi:hypothetical protein
MKAVFHFFMLISRCYLPAEGQDQTDTQARYDVKSKATDVYRIGPPQSGIAGASEACKVGVHPQVARHIAVRMSLGRNEWNSC